MGLTVTLMGSEKKISQHELKKHVATIHCSNTLSLLQRKISNALLFHAYHELLVKDEHEINIKQLCALISYNGNNHGAIKEALKGLLSTVIEWNIVSEGNTAEDWTASSILASVSLKGPLCFYAYSPRMKLLLHSPTMFGKINLFIQSRFKSSYGLALYENCIRYRGLPFTKWLDMDTFRKLMGVPSDKYPIFRDFKRRVLDKSIEEVNTYSDMFVEPDIVREGRQVIKIRFLLKDRAKKVRIGNINPEEIEKGYDSALASTLIMQFGLSPVQAQNMIQQYEPHFIAEKMQIVKDSKNFQSGKIENSAGYLISALKNNYQQTKKSPMASPSEINNQTEIKYLIQYLEEAYSCYREQAIDNQLEQLSPQQKETFMSDFMTYAQTPIKTILKLQRKKYSAATVMSSPQIKGLLRQYALKTLLNFADMIQPIEQFVASLGIEYREAWQQLKRQEPNHPLLEGCTLAQSE